jgi:predicted alpha/beta-fold hydrolase
MQRDHRFKPAWWLKNPHLQTVYARFVGRKRDVPTRQEIVELPDGDFVDCRWSGGDVGPIVIILHGLEGSVESHYVKGMMRAASDLGWRSVLVHFRSCGDSLNRLPRTYHSGDTGDIGEVVRMLREREPNTPLMAVGYSLGGNVLLKWLGETAGENPLVAAVAVSVPFDLDKATAKMAQGIYWGYQNYFLNPLKKKILEKAKMHNLPYDLATVKAIVSIREYDERVTAPLHGFKNAIDYYRQSSSRIFMPHIKIPTLVIQSEDDPFMGKNTIPPVHEVSEHVRMEIYDQGGHVGFVSGLNPFKPQYWLEKRIPMFFEEQLAALKRPFRVA